MFGYFARLSAPIEFQAVDNLPVDLVFLLLSPPDAGADHLKALAGVSRALRDRATAAKLRGARSRDALFALLAASETRDPASDRRHGRRPARPSPCARSPLSSLPPQPTVS